MFRCLIGLIARFVAEITLSCVWRCSLGRVDPRSLVSQNCVYNLCYRLEYGDELRDKFDALNG